MARSKSPSFDEYDASSEDASNAFSSVGSEDTEPELILQNYLSELDVEFETHCNELPGKPDVVFPEKKVAVFCDGDFWHGRNWEERKEKLQQGSNAEYWVQKIRSNRERDARQTEELEEKGWRVLRYWEGQIKDDPEAVRREIQEVVCEETDLAD